MDLGALQRGFEDAPRGERRIGEDETVVGAFGQPDRLAAGQRMVARHDDAGARLDGRQHAQLGQFRHGIADGEVELARDQPVDDLRRAAHQHVQRHQRLALAHVAHQARHDRAREAFHQAEGGVAAHHAAELADMLHQLGMVVLPALDFRRHHLAGRGEPHATRQALEQRRAVLRLQVQDLPVHRRRREVEPRRRAPDRARLRDDEQPRCRGRDDRHAPPSRPPAAAGRRRSGRVPRRCCRRGPRRASRPSGRGP